MGYVDRRRREESTRDRTRTAGPRRPVEDGYNPSTTVGLILALPAVAVTSAALTYNHPDSSWIALLCWLPPAAFLLVGMHGRRGASGDRRRARGAGPGGEKQLLLAMTDAGGGITPVEAALKTSLTVDEAEEILSRLAKRGHLFVQSRDGVLHYTLPDKRPGPLSE